MKNYLVLPFLFAGLLLLLSPESSQANIALKATPQARPVKLSSMSRITIAPIVSQEKKKTAKTSPKHKTSRAITSKNSVSAKKRNKKTTHKRWTALKCRGNMDEAPVSTGISGLDELRQHYQDWRGTRYRAGGSSRAGVDCSGFTALTFREVYGIELPRTAHEQAMQGMPVDRDGLLPGDLVFFKRHGGGDHVGIYLGDGKFMHASSHEGVIISNMYSTYWRDKFWKGSRL
jgi:probable lipoprotein NlpC